ncbi:anti-sigma factor domain-containing protein [Nesterenkonia flava]|uniref:Regulator of SigK n=1 Tax=Nesterenkonia flava TaxID=469799 RepID=A0ABU1FUY3_9MICC|nr:anti-sigma factor [Nesterenkonia flava]MDR5712475.1 anti-sigma factor [Nesterenkonia flava]
MSTSGTDEPNENLPQPPRDGQAWQDDRAHTPADSAREEAEAYVEDYPHQAEDHVHPDDAPRHDPSEQSGSADVAESSTSEGTGDADAVAAEETGALDDVDLDRAELATDPEGSAAEDGQDLETDGGDGESETSAEPTLTELLTGTARGDQASFSAFFESTSDVVYGLALLMHADAEGAHASTIAVYRHLWDQADARARDLRVQAQASQLLTDEYADFTPETSPQEGADDDVTSTSTSFRPSEYELVLEWLVPLAHRIFVERFRERLAEPIPLAAVPKEQGGGVAGLPEEILGDLMPLSDSQAQSLALSYLVGLPHQRIAEQTGAAIPSIKSRLRDAMTRLHTQRTERETEPDPILRAAVTKKDVQRSGAVNRNFTNEIAADLEKGLLVELAELYALDALDDQERALLDESALTAEPDLAQQWDTRVLAARRTLAEIFAAHSVVPPSHLLEELLDSLADSQQDIGMGMVEEFTERTEETEKRNPVMKKWMFIVGFLLIVAVGVIVIWQVTAGQNVQAIADSDPDAYQAEGIEMTQGGEIRAVLSPAEDIGYLEFTNVPELEGNATYQIWLLPVDGQTPSSLGNFTADELEEEVLPIRQLARYQNLQIMQAPHRGEERPIGDEVALIPLDERVTEIESGDDAGAEGASDSAETDMTQASQ